MAAEAAVSMATGARDFAHVSVIQEAENWARNRASQEPSNPTIGSMW